ncbi:MAG: hypothetical protein OHK93_000819 [Ramalina farinacea]|uniref:Uncharacterized protein n=1 Tax=Ramalina farinacea TaxID=258253 RepID=A0AA43QPB4_9LECA|nr:hypothetical protein [Ramalina farinacea]
MHIHRFSSILTLLLTALPTSLTAPPITSVSAGEISARCYQKPEGARCIAPFPSNCRTIAGKIRNMPGATNPMIFDARFSSPTWPYIPVPYNAEFGTCKVNFAPNGVDPSSRVGSNFATYASFAAAIDAILDHCFTFDPGQEHPDFAFGIASYNQDWPMLGTGRWRGAVFGPNRPLQAGSANVTDDGDGFGCTDIVESWTSGNASLNGLVIGGSGTAEQPQVDVT